MCIYVYIYEHINNIYVCICVYIRIYETVCIIRLSVNIQLVILRVYNSGNRCL